METTSRQRRERVMEKFIELVRRGKIDGIELYTDSIIKLPNHYLMAAENIEVGTPEFEQSESDHLCGFIRRWLSGKGIGWSLLSCGLSLDGGLHFSEGSELDWHIQAVIWILERENGN